MKKFIVEGEFSGYSRGRARYEVEAENEEQAREEWWNGKEIYHETVRDDTEFEVDTVREK